MMAKPSKRSLQRLCQQQMGKFLSLLSIIFLHDVSAAQAAHQHLVELAKRMPGARDAMLPLGMSVKELMEAERER
jgi:hypothetical protein